MLRRLPSVTPLRAGTTLGCDGPVLGSDPGDVSRSCPCLNSHSPLYPNSAARCPQPICTEDGKVSGRCSQPRRARAASTRDPEINPAGRLGGASPTLGPFPKALSTFGDREFLTGGLSRASTHEMPTSTPTPVVAAKIISRHRQVSLGGKIPVPSHLPLAPLRTLVHRGVELSLPVLQAGCLSPLHWTRQGELRAGGQRGPGACVRTRCEPLPDPTCLRPWTAPTPGACKGITQTKIAQQVDLHRKEAQRSQVQAWFIP